MKNTYSSNNLQDNLKFIIIFLVITLTTILMFQYLNGQAIREFDESRLAINAYEMYKNGKYFETFYEGSPDLWNTKPPLLISIQAFLMKFIGVNELAFRLPSAIAGLSTCIFLLYFFRKYFNSLSLAVLVVMVLITTLGYVNNHVTRTGDYDGLLILFNIVGFLYYFEYLETKKIKYLYILFITTALAVLTKSITGLLFTPTIFLYTLYRKQLVLLLKNKHFYYGLGIFLFLVLSYYIGREILTPGYLSAVWENELFGRYTKTLDKGVEQKFLYYYEDFLSWRYKNWFWFVPFGILAGLLNKNLKIQRLTIFCTTLIITYFLIISGAKTKHEWYNAPMYPIMAILIGIFLHTIYLFIIKYEKILMPKKQIMIIPMLLAIPFFYDPVYKVFKHTQTKDRREGTREIYVFSYYLKNAIKENEDISGQNILFDSRIKRHVKFYMLALKEDGIKVDFKEKEQVEVGDTVLFFQKNIKEYLKGKYDLILLDKYENINFNNLEKYKILSLKNN